MNEEKEIRRPINWIDWLQQNKYYISNYGNLYNSNGIKMSASYQNSGYSVVTLRDNEGKTHQLLIHKLVLQTFKPIYNKTNMVCMHINGDNTNNKLDNLKWAPIQEAIKNRFTNNRFRDFNINYKEKEQEVIKLIKEGISKKDIFIKTGMNRDYIDKIIKENNIDESQYNQGNHKVNSNTLFDLVLGFCFGLSDEETSKYVDMTTGSIRGVRNCGRYTEDLASLGYTKTHKPYSIIDYEYDLNDINPDSEYTFFN